METVWKKNPVKLPNKSFAVIKNYSTEDGDGSEDFMIYQNSSKLTNAQKG